MQSLMPSRKDTGQEDKLSVKIGSAPSTMDRDAVAGMTVGDVLAQAADLLGATLPDSRVVYADNQQVSEEEIVSAQTRELQVLKKTGKKG